MDGWENRIKIEKKNNNTNIKCSCLDNNVFLVSSLIGLPDYKKKISFEKGRELINSCSQ